MSALSKAWDILTSNKSTDSVMKTCDHAFVLHTRPYRESSQLISLFTRQHGRISALSRGGRSNITGKGRNSAALQPFSLLQVSWTGRSDLKTLSGAEPLRNNFLRGSSLYIGIYLNELLMRLVHENEPHEQLFDHYQTLTQMLTLAAGAEMEGQLRMFEFNLLQDLGYGFHPGVDADSGDDVEPGLEYILDGELGVRLASTACASKGQGRYLGSHLQAIAAGDFSSEAVRRTAKRLARNALAPHLGDKPLMSRELFRGQIGNERLNQ